MTQVPARYFDGQRASWTDVTLTVAAGRVRVLGDGLAIDEPIGAVRVSQALGRTPRQILLPAGHCEVEPSAEVERLLASAGIVPDLVSRWERSTAAVVGAVCLLCAVFTVIYLFVLPAVADAAAQRLPQSVADQLSRRVMEIYEQQLLGQTALEPGRQSALARAIAALELPEGPDVPAAAVLFRSSERLGPNAFALPSGTVVMTDALVGAARDDQELLAIFAHEAGHVHGRHGLRKLLQSSAVGFLTGWYLGDMNFILVLAPTALLSARYSRGFERDADDFAVRVLEANGIPPSRLADILQRLEADAARGGPTAADLGYLSTHPPTAERIARLTGGDR